MQLLDRRVGLVNIAPIVYVRTVPGTMGSWTMHMVRMPSGSFQWGSRPGWFLKNSLAKLPIWSLNMRNGFVWKCGTLLIYWSIIIIHVIPCWNRQFSAVKSIIFRHTQSCCHDWLAPFIGDDAHGDPMDPWCQGGSVRLGLWQLSQFQGTTQASGVENGGKVALTKKKSRAVWKVLLMVGESSNVPVSWCWCVACLITWRNINTEQFGSVLNARCLKRNRQGAGGTT